MSYQFTPPWQEGDASTVPRVTADATWVQRRLFSQIRQVPSARTILCTGGVCQAFTSPSQTQIAAADFCYQGGRTYTVSPAEAAALDASGFGSGLSGIPNIYGTALYGAVVYG